MGCLYGFTITWWNCSGSLAWPESHSQQGRGGDFSLGEVREFGDISSSLENTELPASTQPGQLKDALKTLGGTTELEEKVACTAYSSANVVSRKFNVLITSFSRLSSYFPHPLARLLCIESSRLCASDLFPFHGMSSPHSLFGPTSHGCKMLTVVFTKVIQGLSPFFSFLISQNGELTAPTVTQSLP